MRARVGLCEEVTLVSAQTWQSRMNPSDEDKVLTVITKGKGKKSRGVEMTPCCLATEGSHGDGECCCEGRGEGESA